MEFIRRSWMQVRAYLVGMSFSERAVAVMAVVVLLVVGIWLVSWAAGPELQPINMFMGDRQAEAVRKLEASGIKVTMRDGQVLVGADKIKDAMELLMNEDLMAADLTAAFDEYVRRQSPLLTTAQASREFMVTKMKVLGQWVSRMRGVKAAHVMISVPEEQNFGRNTSRPTASVTIIMQPNKTVEKQLVDAVARLVAGANAPMQPTEVVVVDANRGASYTISSDQETMPSTTLETLKALELHWREKIDDTLRYIKGKIVNVTVTIDPAVRSVGEKYVYAKSEPLVSTEERSTKTVNNTSSGEAGVRSNAGQDISGGTGAGGTNEEVESKTQYGPVPITEILRRQEAGHMPKHVSVTVNVPRSFFVALYKQTRGDSADPDDNAVKSLAATELKQIESQVQGLINIADAKGVVSAYMISDPASIADSATATVASDGGFAMALDGGWVRMAGLGVLVLVALAMMFSMVRKATRQAPIPTVEELAGVPPTLPADDDLVGEAEETDLSMAGVELDEGEIRTRKIAEQISEMVKGNPHEAAALLRRWVRTEE